MIPIENYATIDPDATLRKAALSLRKSFFSQEAIFQAGSLDMKMAIAAAEEAMLAYRENKIMFPFFPAEY